MAFETIDRTTLRTDYEAHLAFAGETITHVSVTRTRDTSGAPVPSVGSSTNYTALVRHPKKEFEADTGVFLTVGDFIAHVSYNDDSFSIEDKFTVRGDTCKLVGKKEDNLEIRTQLFLKNEKKVATDA
jgi:hypothetical protein